MALVSMEEASERLGGLGRTTLFALVRDGQIPSVKIGKRRLFRTEDLDAFIEARIVASDTPPPPPKPRQKTCRACGHAHLCQPPGTS